MIKYKSLYHYLFNGITDIIEMLESEDVDISKAVNILKILQIGAEEQYLLMGDSDDSQSCKK